MINSYSKNIFLSALLGIATFNNANAAVVLEDWIFNIDGVTSEAYFGDAMPTTGALSDGLGTLSLNITGVGTHSIATFFDYEIDQNINGFYNESGQAVGAALNAFNAVQSWEIDEPKYFYGDIIDNVLLGTLDNTNAVPTGSEDDVGFGMGWDLALLEGDVALIDFVFTDVLPAADFYLEQYDAQSDSSLYFYSTINILTSGDLAGPPVAVSEPSSSLLFMVGLLGLFLGGRTSRRLKKQLN